MTPVLFSSVRCRVIAFSFELRNLALDGESGRRIRRIIPHYITGRSIITSFGMFLDFLLWGHVSRVTSLEAVSNRKYLALLLTYGASYGAEDDE